VSLKLNLKFEGGLNDVTGIRPIRQRREGFEFRSGRVNRRCLHIKGNADIQYFAKDVFNPERGTFMAFIRPETGFGRDNRGDIFAMSRNFNFGLYFVDDCLCFYTVPPGGTWEDVKAHGLGGWRKEWHHVAVTWQVGEHKKIYTDGVLAAEGAYRGQKELNPYEIRIGHSNHYTGNYKDNMFVFFGGIDEVRLYDHVLSSDEICYELKRVTERSVDDAGSGVEVLSGETVVLPTDRNNVWYPVCELIQILQRNVVKLRSEKRIVSDSVRSHLFFGRGAFLRGNDLEFVVETASLEEIQDCIDRLVGYVPEKFKKST